MLNLGLAQINPTVGDLDRNLTLCRRYLALARTQGVQLLMFPELCVSGYPPEDLLLRRGFLSDCAAALAEFAEEVEDMVVVIGFPELEGRNPYNSLAVLADGGVAGVYRKHHLPNYGVFDENRYFARGPGGVIARVNGVVCGLSICEDIWYGANPLADEVLAGAEVILNISASPYYAGKGAVREAMLAQRARDHVAAIAYCNLVGGQDELIFDGQSLVLNHHGRVLARGRQFAEQLLVCGLDSGPIASTRLHDIRNRDAEPMRAVPVLADLRTSSVAHITPPISKGDVEVAPVLESPEEVYAALCLGTADYVRKNGFKSVLLGLSGGVDSALVALIAADALGVENVTAVVMPSVFSSNETQDDARQLATNLGIKLLELPIASVVTAYDDALADEFAGTAPGVTEENLQARIRGNLLMALSNKFGWMLLTTGNKSEMSTGYSTLYGDLCGGLAVIKDVPKTLVFALIEWRNLRDKKLLVPADIITRPPSAELAPNQQDSDSLPPYEILDPILERYIEDDESIDDIVAAGFERAVVERVAKLIGLAEYKRRQAPPGLKITIRAFGRDRRMPITNGYSIGR